MMQLKRGWSVLVVLFLLAGAVCVEKSSNEATHLKGEVGELPMPINFNDVADEAAVNEEPTVIQEEEVEEEVEEVEEVESGHQRLSPSEIEFWENVALALFLTVCGAFCSGMGVGLLSISKLELNMMKQKSDEHERKMAQKILSVIEHHHLFLVTLLIANAMALESLPLVVHSLMPDWLAILTSTVIVVIAAEIIPQAFCTGPHKIVIAYYASPMIKTMIKVFWIISYPTAKLLDYLVGEEHDEKIQHKDFGAFLNEDKFLNKTEKLLLTATLDLRGDRVKEKMIKVEDFFMLEEKSVIDLEMVKEIVRRDFSYVLVYRGSRGNIIGIIKIKEFTIKYLQSQRTEMVTGEVMHSLAEEHLTVYEDTNLLEMLMLFQARSTRFALVVNACRKTDKNILSIMYTKNDMIYTKEGAEVIGVIFLYHVFNEMAEIQEKKIKETDLIMHDHEREREPHREVEMDTMRTNLLK